MKLEGRRVIVTGGVGVLASGSAKLFLAEGANVLAVSRSSAKLEGAKAELPALATLAADVSVATDVDRIVEWVEREWGALDILVNNAGVYDGASRASQRSRRHLPDDIQINVHGAYFCTKRLLPLLLRSGDPRILNIGSDAGIWGPT